MSTVHAIGILPGNNLSYIDHLVPLCQIMGIPLLVTEPWVKELVELYYPPMEIVLASPQDYNLDPFLQEYDLFFYVDFFRKGNGSFQFDEYLSTKKVRSVFSFHGNPDKFFEIYWMERLEDEDIVLVYGPQLRDTLRKKGIQKQVLLCGNYRLEFYQKHRAFFDAKIPFKKEKNTALYAPTWSSKSRFSIFKTDYSSFFTCYREVLENYSEKYQLIVKLHPHMHLQMPEEVDEVISAYPHIFFLKNFPPIYPLLMQIDLYLGDYSSIGYDFLYFKRPIIFLGEKQTTPLQQQSHEALYNDAFGDEPIPLDQLRQEIEHAYRFYPV